MSKLIADSHAKQDGGFGDCSEEESPVARRDSAPRVEDDEGSASDGEDATKSIMASAMTKKVRLACSHATRHTPTDTSTYQLSLTPNCQLGNFMYPLVTGAAACMVAWYVQPQSRRG